MLSTVLELSFSSQKKGSLDKKGSSFKKSSFLKKFFFQKRMAPGRTSALYEQPIFLEPLFLSTLSTLHPHDYVSILQQLLMAPFTPLRRFRIPVNPKSSKSFDL